VVFVNVQCVLLVLEKLEPQDPLGKRAVCKKTEKMIRMDDSFAFWD
jgi:hypothetical protein